MTAAEFARQMDYDYTTIMRWLRKGIVPGARREEVGEGLYLWRIPEAALEMRPPRLGRRRKGIGKKGK